MTIEKNQSTLEEARKHFNAGDLDAYITTLYAPDAIAHFLPPGLPPGHQGLRLFYGAFQAAFPDMQLAFEDVVSEGEKTAIRFRLEMTHTGEFNGIPATNKHVAITGITIFRFADGKTVERWSETDMFSLMQQLGGIPSPS